jgi:hypothetical protein
MRRSAQDNGQHIRNKKTPVRSAFGSDAPGPGYATGYKIGGDRSEIIMKKPFAFAVASRQSSQIRSNDASPVPGDIAEPGSRSRGPPFWCHRLIGLMNAWLRRVHGRIRMLPWGG